MNDRFLEMLKASPNCRITITTTRRKHPAKPKPKTGDLKQRGWSWYRWDYSRTKEGHAIVGPRGAYRYRWEFDREANPDEYKAWRASQKEKKLAKLATAQSN